MATASRRAILSGLAALPIVTPALPASTDPVFALIELERQAQDRLCAACRGCDEVALGREATVQEEDEYTTANVGQRDAFLAVMSAAPTTAAGLNAMLSRFEEREMENIPAPIDEILTTLFASVRTFIGRA